VTGVFGKKVAGRLSHPDNMPRPVLSCRRSFSPQNPAPDRRQRQKPQPPAVKRLTKKALQAMKRRAFALAGGRQYNFIVLLRRLF